MNILINYADEHFRNAQKWNTRTGRWLGRFDQIYEFHPEDIDDAFRNAHADIFAFKRGNGLWLWKPYFIDKVISQSRDGDYIFYIDSGAFFIRDPRVLKSYISDRQPVFVCDLPLIESNWTKPECFEALDAWEYKDHNQIQGGIQVILVNEFTRRFYKEWLSLCCDVKLLSPAGLEKYETISKSYGNDFVSHREDQSIFSLLCHKHGIKAHRDFTQRGNTPGSFYSKNYAFRVPQHPDDTYKTIIFLHKMGSFGLRACLSFLKADIKNRLRKIPSNDAMSSLESLQHQIYHDNPNYCIEYTSDNKDCCVIYFTSNDLFSPHTTEAFKASLIKRNRYEWRNIKVAEGCKHIFVRDIYKQWYASGINANINNATRLLDLLRKETDGYRKIITIGSSAGGYASVLFGTLLNADICFSFNGQWTLYDNITRGERIISPILHRMIQEKDEGVKYFNLASDTFNNPNVYYFVSDKSPVDTKQLSLASQLDKVHIIHFKSNHHGLPFLKCALPYVINMDKSQLNTLTANTHTFYGFTIEHAGMWSTFKTILQLTYRKIKRLHV